MFCINCGSKIEEGARFCVKCGKEIMQAQVSTKIQEPPREPVCPSCGEKIIQGNKFCIKCGKPVDATVAAPVPNTPPTAGVFGGGTPEQIKSNIAQGLVKQATDEKNIEIERLENIFDSSTDENEKGIIAKKLYDLGKIYYWRFMPREKK